MRKFIRTCQSCGTSAEYKDPATYKDQKSEAWRETKCKNCKSDDLDYGSYVNDELVDIDDEQLE